MRTCLQLYRQVLTWELIGVMKLCAADANKAACEKEEEGIGGNKHGLLCVTEADVVHGCADKEQCSNIEESA